MIKYNFNAVEREVCLLLSAIEIIDNIVNHSVLQINVNNGICHLLPQTLPAMGNFLAVSFDFFSPAGKILNHKNEVRNCFDLLKDMCIEPKLSKETPSVLIEDIKSFDGWLNKEHEYKDLLTLNNNRIDIIIKSKDIVEICSNSAKHNFIRLDRSRNVLKKVLNANGELLNDDGIMIHILKDFNDQFIGDGCLVDKYIYNLSYHFNNIRCGIRDYLTPIYDKAYKIEVYENDLVRYSYERPDNFSDEGYSLFWDLMNWKRSSEIVGRFDILDCWKE